MAPRSRAHHSSPALRAHRSRPGLPRRLRPVLHPHRLHPWSRPGRRRMARERTHRHPSQTACRVPSPSAATTTELAPPPRLPQQRLGLASGCHGPGPSDRLTTARPTRAASRLVLVWQLGAGSSRHEGAAEGSAATRRMVDGARTEGVTADGAKTGTRATQRLGLVRVPGCWAVWRLGVFRAHSGAPPPRHCPQPDCRAHARADLQAAEPFDAPNQETVWVSRRPEAWSDRRGLRSHDR